jgi:hypothetical protein
MYNKDFLNNTLENFLRCVKTKKLVLFGCGAEMNRALSLFIDCNGLAPEYAVDNDFRKWYNRQYMHGIQVLQPDILADEDKEKTLVLITSIYPYRIKPQIERYGILYYYSSLLFIEPHIGKRQFMLNF